MDEYNKRSSDSLGENMYFAAKPANKVMTVALERAKTFYQSTQRNNWKDKLTDMYRAYYGMFSDGSEHKIGFTGEQGELVEMPINHFRSIARNMYTMVTENRPAMDVLAVNTDSKSLKQAIIAKGVLEYYLREKKLETALMRAVEHAIVLGVGYVKLEWDTQAGDEYDVDPETGRFNYSGELKFSTPSFYDVVVDGTKESWDNEWILVRSFQNKHNLAAKYPDLSDKILNQPVKTEDLIYKMSLWSNDMTDDIPVYEFFHKKTPAMPEGRYILACSEELTLIDVPMPYKDLPVYRIVPSEVMGTPYGYSPMFDCFPIQQMINACNGTISTNINAFGVQKIWIKEGSNITDSEIGEGLTVIESEVPPQPIDLVRTSPEVYRFVESLVREMETISGVNSVARGNPQASLESGAALALVQAMAVQFISQLSQSYGRLIEDVGIGVINILKDYSETPKLITLVGKNNEPYLESFVGETIKDINRVRVDIGNAMSRTLAGRMNTADMMLNKGLIKDPSQYFTVLETGRVDTLYEQGNTQNLLVRDENEQLMSGNEVHAIFTDNHLMHINEHAGILSNSSLRKSPELTQIVAAHIQEHIDLLRNTDPQILQLLGQQPLQPSPQDNLPPGPQQGGPEQGPPGPQDQGPPMQPPVAGPDQGPQGMQGQPPQTSMANPEQQQMMSSEVKANLPNLPTPPGQFANMPMFT
jgi:hypothetical protein